MTNRNKIIAGILALIVSFGVGFFSKPAKTITKTEIKEVVKEVKVVEQHNNIITTTHTVTVPGGTITTDVTTHDDTVIDTKDHTNVSIDAKKEVVVTRDSGLTIQALAVIDPSNLTDRQYGIYVKKRVIGNVSVGATVTTDKKVGIAVGLDF